MSFVSLITRSWFAIWASVSRDAFSCCRVLRRFFIRHLLDQLRGRYLDRAVHGMADIDANTSGAGRDALHRERADGRRDVLGQLGRVRIGSLDREVLAPPEGQSLGGRRLAVPREEQHVRGVVYLVV